MDIYDFGLILAELFLGKPPGKMLLPSLNSRYNTYSSEFKLKKDSESLGILPKYRELIFATLHSVKNFIFF